MNLRRCLDRRPTGRLIHRLLVAVLLVCLVDMNEQTVCGLPAVWVRDALTKRPDYGQSGTVAFMRVAGAHARSGALVVPGGTATPRAALSVDSQQLAIWGQRWEPTVGGTSAAVEGGRLVRLAQAPASGVAGGSPDIDACSRLLARAKGAKVQLVWTKVAGATSYKVYRGLDADAAGFVLVGTATGGSEIFLDSPLRTERTYLYFVRAVGPGVGCDSQVAAAYATTQRGTRNHPPVIYSAPPGGAYDGELLSYRVRAVDPDPGDIVLYELAEAPIGMDLDPVSGELTWAAETGTHSVQVSALDRVGATDVQTFTLDVVPRGVLVPDVVGLGEAEAGAAITAAGLAIGTVSFVFDGLVPEGLVIQQHPVGGTSVVPGTTVDLIISAGPAPLTVPYVVGLPQGAAEAAILAAGLTVGAITTAHDPAVPAGMVISQNPVSGTSVAPGSPVALVVSTGPAPLTVPHVVGLPQGAAEAAILAAGLTVGPITAAHDPAVPTGMVISQNPVSGTSVAPGSPVALVVSTGPAPVTVPDVVGLAQADAETAITDADLIVGEVTLVHDAAVPDGIVISQEPVSGVSVPPGSAVDLVVSLGPEPVSVPAVVGMTQAAAEDSIRAAGLSVGAIVASNDQSVPVGRVISQNPAGGTSVAPGSPVALVISLGPVMVLVPDVVGLMQAAASGAITSAGLTVGAITTVNHPSAPAGTVISQNPVQGTSVPRGTGVALTVSTGPGAPKLVIIEVGPSGVSLEAGNTQQYVAIGTWSDNHVEDITSMVAWLSTDTAVATISSAGLATALDAGTTSIEASLEGVTGNATLTVQGPGLASIVISPEQAILLSGQTQQLTATGVLTDGTSRDLGSGLVWSSSLHEVAEVSAEGVATAVREGVTTISASRDGLLGSAILTVRNQIPDATPPTVAITAPADNATLTSQASIVGTADDPNFLKYVLEFAPAGESSFTLLTEGSAPVVNGVLGQIDPTLLLNDLYIVRLTVFDRGGNSTSASRTYQVARDQKVGLFSLIFEDLNVPVSGLPIRVNRVYDTRDKRIGDFGVGWRLQFQTMSIRANRVHGTGWRVNRVGGGFFFTYVLQPTAEHKVTITLPDGKIEEFDLVPSPSSSFLIPFFTVTPSYQARAGTLGTLLAQDSYDLDVIGSQPGDVELMEFLSFEPYDPQEFQYTAPDGRIYRLSRTAGVRSVQDPNGNTLTFGPNGVVHSAGKGIAFIRDGQGRIIQMTDPNGHIHRYAYDARGDLISHTDALGHTTRHSYNLSHGLIEVRDPGGVRPVRNEYDDQGRLMAHIDAEGNRVEYDHKLGVRQEVITDRRGFITVYAYDEAGNILSRTDPLGGTTTFTFDARGNKLTETDATGATTRFSYDAQNRMLTRTDPLGHTTTYTYNSRGQVLTLTDPLGNQTRNVYDSRGNLLATTDPTGAVTTHTYDASGNLLSTTDPLGNTTTHSYDATGNRLSTKDPLGHTRTFTYDANGNLLTEEEQRTEASGTVITMTTTHEYDAMGREIRTVYPDGSLTRTEYDPRGRALAKIDQRGNRTQLEYDLRGNLVRTIHPDGTEEVSAYDPESNRVLQVDTAGRETRFEYNKVGLLVRTVFTDGTTRQREYDAAGRTTATVDELGNRQTHTIDAAGRVVATTDALGNSAAYAYDAAGNRTAVTDARGNTVTFTYDARGRQTRMTWPDGTFNQTTYDALGRTTAQTDQAGLITTFAYDPLGRLVTVTDPLGNSTRYTYDEVGNRIRRQDALGRVTQYQFDNGHRITVRTLPLGMSETFIYDGAGNIVSRTDFNGATTSFTYDSRNRVTRKSFEDGSAVDTSYYASGKRQSVSTPAGMTLYAYDLRDRPVRVTHPDGTVIQYTYDAAGNRVGVGAPAGETRYHFDALNRVASVVDPAGGLTLFEYDAVGNQVGMRHANGTSATIAHDALNRVTDIVHRDAGGNVLASYQYTLNPTGDRTRVVEAGGRSVDYAYDALHRLVREDIGEPATAVRSISYTYDEVGNRLTKNDNGSVVVSAYDNNDRLLTDGTTSITYDANGNTLTETRAGLVTSHEYDGENRLVAISDPGLRIEYTYDHDGIRTKEVVNGAETRFLVDANRNYAQVLEERDGTGGLRASYVFAEHLVSELRGGSRRYAHSDALGSVRALSGSTGAVSESYDYDAFGVQLRSTPGATGRYRFAGEGLDPATQRYYLRARYYDPSHGRFLTQDPIPGDVRVPVTQHGYLYAGANPVNRLDPSGLFFCVSTPAVGRFIHREIGADFASSGPGRVPDIAINTILGMAVPGGTRRPDLVDTTTQEVYEIKPVLGAALGVLQLMDYLDTLNTYDPLGRSWSGGFTYRPPPRIDVTPPFAYALVFPPSGGLILYCYMDYRPIIALLFVALILAFRVPIPAPAVAFAF